ncbi:MAG: hypothetical protein ACTSP4_16710 [Candidatus Hodarchaeales archaeon]
MSLRLRALLELFLLEELGFDLNEAWKVASSNRGFRYRIGKG